MRDADNRLRCCRCRCVLPKGYGSWCDPCHAIEKSLAHGPRPVRMPEPHDRPPRPFSLDPDEIRVRYGNSPRCIISIAAQIAMREATGIE